MTDDGRRKTGKISTGSVVYILLGILIVASALVLSSKLTADREDRLRTEAGSLADEVAAGPRVRIARAKRGPGERSVELIGEARPYNQATLYAKVSGYLREIKVDYGDRVSAGEVIAVIESPELDRQYDAAIADMNNREIEAKRAWALLPRGISIEEAQNREAAYQVAKATAASLEAQRQYEVIRVPFAGVVTARFADPGALLQNATTTQTAALPLVTISQVDRLKVYSYSDQRNASFIQVGNPAEIYDVTRPEARVHAQVSRTSVQLNPNTRTLLVEFDVDNKNGTLVPGSFIRVLLTLKTPVYVIIPVEALVMQGDFPFVAVVNDRNRVNFRKVSIAHSDGKIARLSSGVEEGERVALSLSAGMPEGQLVQPVETDAQ